MRDDFSFAVTWDYRCPFARNACEHLAVALEAGAAWDVTFVPFSLNQAHAELGAPPARPSRPAPAATDTDASSDPIEPVTPRCPFCGRGVLQVIETLPRWRPPP